MMVTRSGQCLNRHELEQLAAGCSAQRSLHEHLSKCHSCQQQLQEINQDNELLGELVRANAGEIPPGVMDISDDAIPGYEMLRELDRGGQGVVFKARQRATRRTVAVKMLLQGMFATTRQRARFEREVELVASLRHSHIVTVYDSGVTARGRPYLAMEFVDGTPLQEWAGFCESESSNRQSLRATLELFSLICDAVNYAHQRGVIHRDLKPANVLVDAEDQPHILDFGLAKAVATVGDEREFVATQAGEFLGTFAYAAPEQVTGNPEEVDTRTDVYGLGIMLYEALTGRRPYELTGGVGDIISGIQLLQPTPPSQWRDEIDDDLETIILTALAKEPDRRYQSAGALHADIRHYLAGEPIDARRDSTWYVLRKTLVRHRLPVGVAALFFLLVVTFGGVMTGLYENLRSETIRATTAEQEAIATLLPFLDSLRSLDPYTTGQLETRKPGDFLDFVSEQLETDLAAYPAVAARVRTEIGLVHLHFADYDRAESELARALRLRKMTFGEKSVEVAESQHNLGRVYFHTGNYVDAEAIYREALTTRQELLGKHSEPVAMTLQHIASCLREQKKFAEADTLLLEALDIREHLYPANHPLIAGTLNNRGVNLRAWGDAATARGLFEDVLAILHPEDQAHSSSADSKNAMRVALTLQNVASCAIILKDFTQAEDALAASLELKRSLLEEDHPSIANTHAEYARLRLAQDRPAEAREHCDQAITSMQTYNVQHALPDLLKLQEKIIARQQGGTTLR